MYKATINGNLFFDTSVDDDRYTLLSADVIKEKGGAGSFTFTVPACNICYGQFSKINDYVDLYRNDEVKPFFFGRVYSTNQLFDNSIEVVCEGMLAVLCDTIFDPITHEGNLHALVQLLLASHNSQVEASKRIYIGTLYVDDDPCYRAYENYENTWKRFEDLLDSFGGFLYLYRENGTMYLDWKKICDTGSSQRVDFGENLIDVQRYHDANMICTVLTPLGEANQDNVRLDISSVNQGSKRLYADQEYITRYGYIHKVQIWDDVTVASNLKTKGQAYLESCLAEQYTVSITAVDMANAGYNIDHFDVGQTLRVTSVPNGIDGVFFDVNVLVLDLFDVVSDRLELGTEFTGYVKMRNNYVHDLRMDLEKNYPTRSAVESATRLITGNQGGYVVMHDSNEDGHPDEILVMDEMDILQTQKVWRWNNSGFGYSNTGYNGTFGTAITMDGYIVGSYILANSIEASKLNVTDLQAIGATIGGFDIDSTSIHTHNVAITSNATNSVGLSSSTFTRTIGGTSRSDLKFAIGANFGVSNDGSVYADSLYSSNANITGGTIQIETSDVSFNALLLRYRQSGGYYQTQYSPIAVVSYFTSGSGSSLIERDTTLSVSGLSLGYSKGGTLTNSINMSATDYDANITVNPKRYNYRENNCIILQATSLRGLVQVSHAQNAYYAYMDGTYGNIKATGTITPGSDRRLKDEIRLLDNEKCAEFVHNMKPSSFKLISDPRGYHHGFIAQDIEELLMRIYGNDSWKVVTEAEPQIEGELRYKFLSYMELLADVVATIQTHNERLKVLEQGV